jgi:branched-chain amino acid transport system substrate-binding protein
MRKIVALLIAVVLVGGTGSMAAEAPPLKIGYIAPLSGVFAPTGRDMLDGMNLFLETNGGMLGGRRVQLIAEDDVFDPRQALTKLRKLVDSDRIDLLTGIVNSAAAYAMRESIDQAAVPTVVAVAGGDDLTQRLRARYMVRTGWGASSQFAHPFGVHLARTLGYRRVATIADDFAFGHEWIGGFQRTFEESGGRVVQKIWSPLGTADFSPFLARIPRDVDAVISAVVGPIALRFVRQYSDFGLRGQIALFGPGHMTDEINLPQMGDEAVGMMTVLHYSAALDNQWNRQFTRRYAAKTNRGASAYAEAGWAAALWMDRALRRIGGQIRDKEGFVRAMQGLVIADSPRGPMRMDGQGNVVHNMYIRRVDRVGGRLQNTVVATFPNVSQFWTYDPQAFLRAPVYGRDNPPCQFCGR